jgi:hypothetical protein
MHEYKIAEMTVAVQGDEEVTLGKPGNVLNSVINSLLGK